MNTRTLVLGLTLVCFHCVAHAQLFKCKDANGRYSFQNSPCASEARLPDIKRPVVGEKDPGFAQRNKDNRPDPNWQPRVPFPTAPQPAPVNAARPAADVPQAEAWKKQEQESRSRRAEEQGKAAQDQIKLNNRQRECSQARQQLGVLNESRPVFSRDSKGEKQYVPDAKRPAEIAAATRRVAEACN